MGSVSVNLGSGCSISKCVHGTQFLGGMEGSVMCPRHFILIQNVPSAVVLRERTVSLFWVYQPTLEGRSF